MLPAFAEMALVLVKIFPAFFKRGAEN